MPHGVPLSIKALRGRSRTWRCSPRTPKGLISRAIADTLAIAAAGLPEPVTRNVMSANGGEAVRSWSGEGCESAEAAVMVNAIAAHALDFDDVYFKSMAHISTVLLPTVLRAQLHDPEAVIDAFAAGLVAAKAAARRVGQGHYRKGWHGTGTIGAFAAAAAAGRLEGLDADQMANAFALAASMSGGLQSNFSTQAKPVHAGFAAVAGMRAARLARAGVTLSREIFGERGYPDLSARFHRRFRAHRCRNGTNSSASSTASGNRATF